MHILALLLPPLACWGVGRFWHGVLNLLMCSTIVLLPAAIWHAWVVVERAEELAELRRERRRERIVVVREREGRRRRRRPRTPSHGEGTEEGGRI